MEAFAPYAIGASVVILLLCGLGTVFAGIKSLVNGKVDMKKIISMAVPFAVFGVTYAMYGNVDQAGMATMLFMLVVMLVMLVFTGLKSTIKL